MMIKEWVFVGLGLITAACVGDREDAPPEPVAEARRGGWADLDVVPYVAEARVWSEVPSREELADAMRPVVFGPEGGFVMREPHWAAADAAPRAAARAVAGQPGEDEAVLPPTAALGPVILGGDGRSVVTNTTVAPSSSVARVTTIRNSGVASRCTGTYIGPWTFVLAAHCLREPDGTLSREIIFEPGKNGFALPFPQHACSNADADATNNFYASIPYAYATSANLEYDFAVIDTYPCHNAQHWLGEPAHNQGIAVDSGTTTYQVLGYPEGVCPGATTGGLFQCGELGTGYANGAYLESDNLDTDDGESGGPWLTGGRVAGTQIGYREYGDFFRCGLAPCRRVYARRIDATYKTFLDAISYDYP